jgi:hypothetical protein
VLFISADLEYLGIEKPCPRLIRISCNSLNIPKEVAEGTTLEKAVYSSVANFLLSYNNP